MCTTSNNISSQEHVETFNFYNKIGCNFIYIYRKNEEASYINDIQKEMQSGPLSNGNDRACKDLQQQYRGIQIEQERVQ